MTHTETTTPLLVYPAHMTLPIMDCIIVSSEGQTSLAFLEEHFKQS